MKYTAQQLDFLRTGYLQLQVPELTLAFNERFGLKKTEQQIKSTLSNHKMRCGRMVGVPAGTFRSYTNEQAEFLREGYQTMTVRKLTIAFNRRFEANKTEGQIRAFTRNHAFKSGRTGQFEKGLTPWNKGGHYVAGGRSAETRFRKGITPRNHLPVGSERSIKGGYIKVKVAEPNVWKLKHRAVWEQHHGDIPPGHIVSFRDGDPANCHPENLALITMAENAIRNKQGGAAIPEPIKESVELLAKLHAKKRQLEMKEKSNMSSTAVLSTCGKYRYELTRTWDIDLPAMMLVGLNPSTADSSMDDPTIRRCIGFAEAWGYGGIVMTNLFAWRATNPEEMLAQPDPIGNGNDNFLVKAAKRCAFILVCWGVRGAHDDRDKVVFEMLSRIRPVHCLAKNQDGSPKHPLYVKGDVTPMIFQGVSR